MSGFEVKFQDMAGDSIIVHNSPNDRYSANGAIAVIMIAAGWDNAVVLDRSQLVAFRAAIDMILNADEFRQFPPGKSPSTT
jgi:hypothetical protein